MTDKIESFPGPEVEYTGDNAPKFPTFDVDGLPPETPDANDKVSAIEPTLEELRRKHLDGPGNQEDPWESLGGGLNRGFGRDDGTVETNTPSASKGTDWEIDEATRELGAEHVRNLRKQFPRS